MSKISARAVLLLLAAFFAAFFAWPVVEILKGGFSDAGGHFTLGYVYALLADPVYLAGLRNSLLVASASTALAVLIALPLAYATDRFRFPGRALFGSLLLVPMILPPFVGAIGIRVLLGRYGALNALAVDSGLRPAGWTFDWLAAGRFWGVVAVDALSLYPIVYLNAIASLANVDPALEEAAENLGCTGLRRFRRVTLPLIKPGLFAGGTLAFIWAFTDLGTPLVFDYDRVASVQIYSGLRDIGGNPLPFALVAVTMATSALVYVLGRAALGRTAFGVTPRATVPGGPRRLPRPQAWLWTGIFSAVCLVALLPHLCVVLVAFSRDWYATALPDAWTLGNFRAALGHPSPSPR
jgi:iron(III) transport system permease protein